MVGAGIAILAPVRPVSGRSGIGVGFGVAGMMTTSVVKWDQDHIGHTPHSLLNPQLES